MTEVISVRFKEVGKSYYFDPDNNKLKKGDMVIVETARGIECGTVTTENREVPDEEIVKPLKMLIRVATADDIRVLESNRKKEAEAFGVCEKTAADLGLDMKLVEVECTFDGSKMLFYFTSDGRVDFRELVKILAGRYRTRIEMRQIGVRDQSKLIGGLGICGRPFCCSGFLGDFHPVSIKMAKEQGLSLNPVKISGTCGRLMCCLKYEQEAYEYLLKVTPKPGAIVETPDGRGTVADSSLLTGVIKVNLDRRPEAAASVYSRKDITVIKEGRARADRGNDAELENIE